MNENDLSINIIEVEVGFDCDSFMITGYGEELRGIDLSDVSTSDVDSILVSK